MKPFMNLQKISHDLQKSMEMRGGTDEQDGLRITGVSSGALGVSHGNVKL